MNYWLRTIDKHEMIYDKDIYEYVMNDRNIYICGTFISDRDFGRCNNLSGE